MATEINIRFPRVVGHRGAAGHAPENTIAGLRKAAALGATWVEFDVVLTGDGVPVLLHDDTLDRTTNGTGNIADMNLDEIRSLDAGSWFSKDFASERIPTLAEVIPLLESLGLGANIEIKPTDGREAETGRIVAEFVAAAWPNTLRAPLFSSFRPEAVAAAQAAAPAIPRGLLLRRLREGWQDQARRLDCVSIHCNQRYIRRDDAAQVRDAGYRFLAYTVNDGKRARQLFDMGVESVFSDYPDRILAM